MEATAYFERTLFHDRSPVADEFYEESSDKIFERDSSKTHIAVRVQSCNNDNESHPLSRPKHTAKPKNHEKSEHAVGREINPREDDYSNSFKNSTSSVDQDTSDDDDSRSLASWVSQSSSTALPSAVDQNQAGSDPPLYPGPPKLTCLDIMPAEIESFVERTRGDFRVFYLQQRHSYSRLQITREDFERLLASCHVFPRFNEYVIGFGNKTIEVEVGPPPLKFRTICTYRSNMYRGFECAYILRYVERTNRHDGRRLWSLRQFAVYHRFKPARKSRCSTWILVGASARTKKRLDQYTRSVNDLMETNPLELHVILLDTVITSWRPYLSHLTQLVSEQSNKASGVSLHDIGGENFVSISVEDHQQLKQIEDYIADLILCLDSTSDTLVTLEEMYVQYSQHQYATEHRRRDQTGSLYNDAVAVALKEKAREITYTRRKAESLLSKVQNTRTLILSLLERQSGHNIEQLGQQGQVMAKENNRDSSSMRVLTIITMIYLPCTIVSNFYSTQFVNQKELDGGIMKLGYAQNAWLFFAISVPLTIFTFVVWYSWLHVGRMREQLESWLQSARKAELPR